MSWILKVAGFLAAALTAGAQAEYVLASGKPFGYHDLMSGTALRAAVGFEWMLRASFTPAQRQQFFGLCINVWQRGAIAEAKEIWTAAAAYNMYAARPAEREQVFAQSRDRFIAAVSSRTQEPLFAWLSTMIGGAVPQRGTSTVLTGLWRGTKYSGLNFEILFRGDGSYEYRVRDRAAELAHEGNYSYTGGRLSLTPAHIISAGNRFLEDAIRNEAIPGNRPANLYCALSGGELRLNMFEPIGGVHDFRVLRSADTEPAGGVAPPPYRPAQDPAGYDAFRERVRTESRAQEEQNRREVEESLRQEQLRRQQEQDRLRQERLRQPN